MASKDLQIIIRAVDQASAPIGGVQASVARLGTGFATMGRAVTAAMGSVISSLTSVRTLVTATLGALAARQLYGSFRATIDLLDELGDTATRTGLSLQTLSALKFGAEQTGQSFEQLAGFVNTAQTNLGRFAINGTSRANVYIRQLGINVRDARGQIRDLNDLIPEIDVAIRRLDPARQGAFAAAIFGSPEALDAQLSRVREFGRQAAALGAIFTPAQVAAAEAYVQAIGRVEAAWAGLKARVVEEIAPELTAIVNNLAAALAVVPQAVGNLTRTLRAALSGDAGAAKDLEAFLEVLGYFLVQGLYDLGDLLIRTGIGIADAAATVLADVFGRVFRDRVASVFETVGELDPTGMLTRLGNLLRAAEGLKDSAGPINLFARRLNEISETDAYGANAAVRNFSLNVQNLGAPLAESAERILRIGEAFAKVREEITSGGGGGPGGPGGPVGGDSFFAGFAEGMRGLRNEIESWRQEGVRAAQEVARAFSSNLSDAIFTVIKGTESLGDAFRNFASRTLDAVTQLIIQILVLRAVAGIGGAIFGGGTDAAGSLPFAGRAGVASGGLIVGGSRGVLRMAGGGYVPGPSVARDIVPAVLMPGEFVLSRRAAAAAGLAALAAFNAGGPVPPAMAEASGTASTPAIVVNITMGGGGGAGGGSGDEARLRAAARAGVLEALNQSAAYRQQVRRALGSGGGGGGGGVA
jgi:hypothetical protein